MCNFKPNGKPGCCNCGVEGTLSSFSSCYRSLGTRSEASTPLPPGPRTGSQGTAQTEHETGLLPFFADPCHCSTPSLAPTIFVVLICPRCAHSCLNFVPMVRWNAVFTPSPLAPGVCCVGHKPWCPRVIIPDPPLVSGLPRLPSVCFFLPCTTRIARKFAATPWESPT